jgi:hypothetical protein
VEVLLTRTPNGALIPLDDEQAEKLRKLKQGGVVRADIKQVRNPGFFRKWWKLVNWAFELWCETATMPTHRGRPVQPSLETFRKDVTILAGYRHVVVKLNGDARWEADSISFAGMDEETFEKLYSATINVILGKVLDRPDLSPEKVRQHVDYLLTFDS